jgi:gamma-glutamyltranspeptidase
VEPDNIILEKGIPKNVRQKLSEMGHKISPREHYGLGNAHGLAIEYDSEGKPVMFFGGADPRGNGLAKGY